MNRRHRISVPFEKRDWGSGTLTWRRGSAFAAGKVTTRRLSNKLAKRAWFTGACVKAY